MSVSEKPSVCIPLDAPHTRVVAVAPSPEALEAAAQVFARIAVARALAEVRGYQLTDDQLTLFVECGSMSPEVEKASSPTVGAVDED